MTAESNSQAPIPDLASYCAASHYTFIKQHIFGENTRPFAPGGALAYFNRFFGSSRGR